MSPNIGFPVVLAVNVVFAALVFGAERLLAGALVVLLGVGLLAFR